MSNWECGPWGKSQNLYKKADAALDCYESVKADDLAGEPIQSKLVRAPGNDAPVGGLKVTTENGWFAARPSGTEDIYKIYAESFKNEAHVEKILEDAQSIVDDALRT